MINDEAEFLHHQKCWNTFLTEYYFFWSGKKKFLLVKCYLCGVYALVFTYIISLALHPHLPPAHVSYARAFSLYFFISIYPIMVLARMWNSRYRLEGISWSQNVDCKTKLIDKILFVFYYFSGSQYCVHFMSIEKLMFLWFINGSCWKKTITIYHPYRYKIFDKALERVQHDNQVGN